MNSIAQRFNTSVEALARANNILLDDSQLLLQQLRLIQPGTLLVIPDAIQ